MTGAKIWKLYAGKEPVADRLIDPEGSEMPEFLLQVSGDEAWWRFSETPSEDD